MPAPADVTLMTSVVAGDLTRQRAALQSWANAGFAILSLNDRDEHAAVAAAGRDLPVTFAAAGRSLQAVVGRPLVYLDDLLAAGLAAGRSHIALINADIGLRDADRLASLLAGQPFDLLYGSRLDVARGGAAQGTVFDGGYDFFVMSRTVAAAVPPSMFGLGRPFYDFYLPFVARMQGFVTVECRCPVIEHVMHPARYDANELCNTAVMMANAILDQVAVAGGALPADDRRGTARPDAALALLTGLFGGQVARAVTDITKTHAEDLPARTEAVHRLFDSVHDGVVHFLRQGALVLAEDTPPA